MKFFRFILFLLLGILLFASCGKFETGNIPVRGYDVARFPLFPERQFGQPLQNAMTPFDWYLEEKNDVERTNEYYQRWYDYYKWKHNEYWYVKRSIKWLKCFYADLYACDGNMQKFSEKYAENIDSVLRPTLAAAYAKANGGADGLDWSLFGFNVKDSAEAKLVHITYSREHWFKVQLLRKDTLTLKVRIENYKPKVLINGLLKPQGNVIMTPFYRKKIQAIVRLFHDLGECTNKDFTDRYAITFTPEILDSLRYGDRDGYDWDKLKIGKEKFTAIRDEDVTYLGDDWFFIAPLRRKVGFIVLQVKVKGLKFKVTGFKVPDQPS